MALCFSSSSSSFFVVAKRSLLSKQCWQHLRNAKHAALGCVLTTHQPLPTHHTSLLPICDPPPLQPTSNYFHRDRRCRCYTQHWRDSTRKYESTIGYCRLNFFIKKINEIMIFFLLVWRKILSKKTLPLSQQALLFPLLVNLQCVLASSGTLLTESLPKLSLSSVELTAHLAEYLHRYTHIKTLHRFKQRK